MSAQFDEIIRELGTLDLKNMYGKDFFLTWDKTGQELAGVFAVADALRDLLAKSLLRLIDLQTGTGDVRANQIVARAIQIVKQRFQEDVTLVSVAEELNVSLFYLSKLFRKHTGTNFTEYLTQLRVEHAKSLLAAGEMSVKEVAYAAGFNSQSYFSKIFKKYAGVAPSEYKG